MKYRGRDPKRRDAVSDAFHPIPLGQRITVLKLPRDAAPCAEGVAVIRGPARGPHRYRVQFNGDPVPRVRIVHPEYQDDPEQFLRILLDLWRASNEPELAEFFPDEDD